MRQKWLTRAAGMLVVVIMMSVPTFVLADFIYLKNGGIYYVRAWRSVGDEIEFSAGGGIIRVQMSEVYRIEGKETAGDLMMYSARPTLSECDPSTFRIYSEYMMCLYMLELTRLEARRIPRNPR
jgi:hypothetical protein